MSQVTDVLPSRRLGERRVAPVGLGGAPIASVERVAIAWELALSPAVIPIPGATRPETILDSVQAAGLVLGPEDRELLGGVTARPADQVPLS